MLRSTASSPLTLLSNKGATGDATVTPVAGTGRERVHNFILAVDLSIFSDIQLFFTFLSPFVYFLFSFSFLISTAVTQQVF